MELLERSSLLDELSGVLAATAAVGYVVLVAGEAGIGKSALVKRFTERHFGGRAVPVWSMRSTANAPGARPAPCPSPTPPCDVVLSTCGAMFAPDQEQTARELLRVCRPGGRIGMVNWVPDSYVGELFRTIGRYLPPPPGLQPPVLWGRADRLRELFGPEVTISAPQRSFRWRFPSAEHQVEFFTTFYGPANRAVATLPADRAAGLKAEMLEAVKRFNVSDDETLVLRMDYLEAVIHKPATE